jgi:hypothetical protein
MSKFIFWTGVYNIIGGITFLVPGMADFLRVKLMVTT